MAPVKGAIRLAVSLISPVVMMMVMEVMEVMMMVRLCAWNRANRERNSGDGGQNESKFSHENTPWAGFVSEQKMAKAPARVKQIFMNARSGMRVHGWRRDGQYGVRSAQSRLPRPSPD
ncbi:MAG: hypothetical protein P4M05_31750 [Bradyrhizobium sp.]|nr:hypothetical protein [Bradyrhizobium sp.]